MLEVDKINEYTSKKILPFASAKKIIDEYKKQQKKVGLCHGGYDLLHPGHIKHFESAKKLCDILFVSITSDRYVTDRKGRGRPIFSETLRAYAIAALASVDHVVISDYKRATDVIMQLKPSFYIKGPDFIHKTTPGITEERQAIKAVGGDILYTNDPTLSTTKIIDYIITTVARDETLVIVDRDGTLVEETEFLGKEKNWKETIQLNTAVVNFLSAIQTQANVLIMVVTNQAGVARGYFTCERVEEINAYIDSLLKKNRVTIHMWQYCPDVDRTYAEKTTAIPFNKEFIKEKTRRKPCGDMVQDGLTHLKKNLNDFQRIIVVGDRHEDEGLAQTLHVQYIDIKGKTTDDLLTEFRIKKI
jgi:rfaE bifunctional protein nucleotidyltransferase chain/domain